jgi:hypothetical protein
VLAASAGLVRLISVDKTDEYRRALEMAAPVEERGPDDRVSASFGHHDDRR